MKAHNHFVAVTLAIFSCVCFASEEEDREDKKAARTEALSDRTPGTFSPTEGTDLSLIATEEGGRAVGRVTWSPGDTYRTIFSLEASAPLDENNDEVELLNLDGLSSGKSSVKAYVSFSGSWQRGEAGDLRSFCIATNKALEHELAVARKSSTCSRNNEDCKDPATCGEHDHTFERISREECTRSTLRRKGESWREAVAQADAAALQAGCEAIAKIAKDQTPLEAARLRSFGFKPAEECTASSLEKAIREAYDELVVKKKRVLSEEASKLQEEVGALAVELRRAENPDERAEIKKKMQETARKLTEKEEELTALQGRVAKLQAGGSPLVEDPAKWIAAKRQEKLDPVCRRFNYPDRKHHIVVDGDGAKCIMSEIPAAISAISDLDLRNRFSRELSRESRFSVWFLTFTAGANNRDFKFLTDEALSSVSTFSDLEEAIKKDTKEDTSLGVRWSVQLGGHLLGVGYEYRNKFVGAGVGQYCVPIATDGTTIRCLETESGAPLKIDQNLGLLEWRTYPTSQLGLRLRLYFIDEDFRLKTEIEDEWELQARLYFLRNKENGLSGGIDVTYDTAFKDVGVRAFIGQSFNIFD